MNFYLYFVAMIAILHYDWFHSCMNVSAKYSIVHSYALDTGRMYTVLIERIANFNTLMLYCHER